VDAVLGQYVVPNRSCDPQIEKDSGGLAGRISRIIRCDGSIESASNEAVEIGGTRQENAEEGREIVFVEWAVNSIERGGFSPSAIHEACFQYACSASLLVNIPREKC
jgi:hypothetical protein